MATEEEKTNNYMGGSYWQARKDLMYYRYLERIVGEVAGTAESMIDVGTGNSPYLEWFDWIPEKVSIDIRAPYSSENVTALTANILEHDFGGRRFDICTCLQVLEHVTDAAPFAERLFDLSDKVVVSVPYLWPADSTKGHVHDPVDLEKVVAWCGREPKWDLVVPEPFAGRRKNKRLIAYFE